MFHNLEMGKLNIFKSVSLINTVTCVKFIDSFLLAGIGNILLIYDIESRQLCGRKKIFDRSTIHGIQFDTREKLALIYGEKDVAVYKMNIQNGFHLQFDCILMTTDWVCHVFWVNSNSFLTLSANNKATLWSYDHKIEIKSSKCDEKCILYSATSVGNDEKNIIIFSGTVFNEILIWSPFRRSNISNILHRLRKHEGVIFSITVSKCHSVISSSSDDRSIVIWVVEPPAEFQNMYDYWANAKISPNYVIYSHKARIWKSIVMKSGNILSAGEDGQICLKTPSLSYQWEESRGSQIRSLDYMEKNNLVASGCTTGNIGLCSLNSIPKSEILVDYASANHYPKQLVVLNKSDTYVLYSDGHVVFYKNNISHNVYQDEILCCTLTMVISPCKTKLTFTTSSGYIVILEIMGEKCIQIFIDQISPVKILSAIWLNYSQIIVSFEGNIIHLYDVSEDLHLNLLDTFVISTKINSWIKAATIINNLIFVGCNEGSICLFKLHQKEPLKVFSKIHSFAGVTAIWTHKKFEDCIIISSVGRDGTHRYWKVCTESETMIDIRLEMLPTKWPFLIVNSTIHGLLICGFKESNLIVYNPTEQTILANVFCGGGHRAWGLTIDNSCNSIYLICSSSNSNLERKEIPLNGQHILLNGFHSMIINSMAEIKDDIMVTVSDDTTVRLTRFNDKIIHLLTLRSHISSVRSVTCLPLKPNVYIIVTVGGRAQLKIWTLNIIDEDIYCEKSASHLLYSIQNKKLWRLPPNEGDMRFMDVCVQYIEPKFIIIFVACSDGTIRLYRYDISNKALNLLFQSLNYDRCMLKMLKVQINNIDYILSTCANGIVLFWNISELNYERFVQTSLDIEPVYQYRLHKSGINCCDWLEIKNKYYLLATGGDDQHLKLSVFQCIVNAIFKCDISSIFVHYSQVTGVKVFNNFVVSASVDQNIIFSSWSFDMNNKSIKLSPLTSYFTTVPDIHGLIAQQIDDSHFKVIVYGKGVETINADMSFSTNQSPTAKKTIQIEAVTPALELGEGPHWDVSTQSLYFVDLHKSKINRYHPETGGYFSATIGAYKGPVSFVIPVKGQTNTYSVGLRESLGVVKWDGRTAETSRPEYLRVVHDAPGVRLNDAKADSSGRLWLGTMGGEIKENPGNYYKHHGALFSVEADGIIVERLSNVSISNGLAWSLDNKEFYYIDTYKFAVEAYDFDIDTGELTNGRVIFDLSANKIDGDPDGMTIDTNGNLWVACFNSDLILKIDPKTGKLLSTVHLPAYQITSAAFGGPDLGDLYVTTAAHLLTEEQKSKKKLSGAVFKLTGTGSTGYAGVPANIHLCPENELDVI